MRRNIDCASAQISSRSSARATATSASRRAIVSACAARSSQVPGSSVAITARSTSMSECASACLREIQRAMEPSAGLAQLGERLGMPRRRRAQPLQRVRAPAKLLQNGVVRDGPQFARMADARGAAPCRRPAAPPAASRCGPATPARTRRAARHSRHPPPAPPSPRGRWRRSRRRNPDRRRPGPRSVRQRDDRSARRCA